MKKLKLPTEERFPKGWSYSAWGMFKTCMFRYYAIRILGMKEESNQFMERGITLHKMAEQYLKGNVTKLPTSFNELSSEYRNLKAASPIVEQFWGVSPVWKPMNYGSWVVMKMDAAVAPSRVTDNHLFIQDLKSGRDYPEHVQQGSLYGCIGMALFPKAEGVEAEFWYHDQGFIIQFKYDRDVIKQETKLWTERGKEILSPRKKWPKTPSPQGCKWCFLRTDKGGMCDGWKDVEGR